MPNRAWPQHRPPGADVAVAAELAADRVPAQGRAVDVVPVLEEVAGVLLRRLTRERIPRIPATERDDSRGHDSDVEAAVSRLLRSLGVAFYGQVPARRASLPRCSAQYDRKAVWTNWFAGKRVRASLKADSACETLPLEYKPTAYT